mmetsp:Transcript_8202/g.23739  ORF Transcript_8202/g.23739 Transcript_8202/m.23739 type:complete len:229 (-) Transcript_8202:36-722(-)
MSALVRRATSILVCMPVSRALSRSLAYASMEDEMPSAPADQLPPTRRSGCEPSPRTQSVEPLPSRSERRLSCCSDAFCASSTMTNAASCVRPRMPANDCVSSSRAAARASAAVWSAITLVMASKSGVRSRVLASSSSSSSARPVGSGRPRMTRATLPLRSRWSPSCTANSVFPVPAGPKATMISAHDSWRWYRRCPSLFGTACACWYAPQEKAAAGFTGPASARRERG